MRELLNGLRKLGFPCPFYETLKESISNGNNGKPRQEKQSQELTSLAELSRQYLLGKIGIEEYLARERILSPQFEEHLRRLTP
jgi:hypothetical protein